MSKYEIDDDGYIVLDGEEAWPLTSAAELLNDLLARRDAHYVVAREFLEQRDALAEALRRLLRQSEHTQNCLMSARMAQDAGCRCALAFASSALAQLDEAKP